MQRWKPKKQERRQNTKLQEKQNWKRLAVLLLKERWRGKRKRLALLQKEKQSDKLNSRKQKQSAKQKSMHKRNLKHWKHRWHLKKPKRNLKSVLKERVQRVLRYKFPFYGTTTTTWTYTFYVLPEKESTVETKSLSAVENWMSMQTFARKPRSLLRTLCGLISKHHLVNTRYTSTITRSTRSDAPRTPQSSEL